MVKDAVPIGGVMTVLDVAHVVEDVVGGTLTKAYER